MNEEETEARIDELESKKFDCLDHIRDLADEIREYKHRLYEVESELERLRKRVNP